ncbi:hypothetical protein FIV42_12875 [Persicimonas caeni]|uniref:Uncharacterized protein n=1 Tax=Persicimonas caeni TaxID=2292766 RepID=A0A4Y6PTI0_PERCE|nr:hypothetical protein [Persicimonas caeni]QDG51608.1 hypothetical protein FIV42_12875 [Persicimonas caeni]QED32829.1 hypothetical protein FRD00_12870 [Persicimonas caeni]
MFSAPQGRSGFTLKTVIAFALTFGGIAYFIINSSEQPGSPALQQGQRVMYQVMGKETLQAAGFYKAYPSGRPSDFVNFLQTSQGRRLWPKSVSEHRDAQIPGANRGPSRVLKPDDLSFSAHKPAPSAGRQIVYVPLDDTGQMEVRGYERADAKPVFVYTWEFPTDAGKVALSR